MQIKFSVHITSGVVYKQKTARATQRNTGDLIMEYSNVLRFTVDYPLTRPKVVECVHPENMPWTQNEFVTAVREAYQEIYASEEDPGHIPGMLNRARSEGPYGIWGHDLNDLVLEGAERNPDGSWKLIVGS